jgi:hypothetical protein
MISVYSVQTQLGQIQWDVTRGNAHVGGSPQAQLLTMQGLCPNIWTRVDYCELCDAYRGVLGRA